MSRQLLVPQARMPTHPIACSAESASAMDLGGEVGVLTDRRPVRESGG